jgi:folate-binding protein YgfZ
MEAYASARSRAAWIERSDQARIAISGPDRAKFLHNLTTHEVKRLGVGQGCEAFVTSPQGRALGYVTLHVEPEQILLRTGVAAMTHLGPHFQKYGVFDDVIVNDMTPGTAEFHVPGPASGEGLRRLGAELPPEPSLSSRRTRIEGGDVLVIRESLTGQEGYTLVSSAEFAPQLRELLGRPGALEGVMLSQEAFDALRIEAGTPVFGMDVTAENLPQEIGRDAQAISFVKGCYLGQETVARLDAVGHVNKILKAFRLRGDRIPARGTPLQSDGKVVGHVTSAAYSPGWHGVVGLAIVRVSHAHPGIKLAVDLEGAPEAMVYDLPMLPV